MDLKKENKTWDEMRLEFKLNYVVAMTQEIVGCGPNYNGGIITKCETEQGPLVRLTGMTIRAADIAFDMIKENYESRNEK